jgi:hypothetical protein
VVREIQRWEAGEHAPDERYQLLLAHAYATRNGSATIEPGSDLDRLLAALAVMGVSLDRRTFLRRRPSPRRRPAPERSCPC